MLTGSSNLLKFIISGDSSQLQQEMQKAERTVTGFADSAASGAGRMRTVTGQIDGMTTSAKQLDATTQKAEGTVTGFVDKAASGAGRMRTVTGQIDGLTMSTKQLNAATRGLPAQFTDIFVSLQGGQAPLTVLLQQGGQLKDMFGGIGPAARAMGGYIMGLVNPYSVAAAAVLALGVAYYQGSAEQDKWHKTLVTTGNAMGVTTSELRGYAQQLDGVVGTQRAAAAGLNDMLAAGVAGGSQLRDYTQAAMAWESATGQAVSDTAKQFKGLAGEPLKAVVKLNEGTNFLTLDLYEQIKSLEAQGNTTEAARVAQDAYAQTLNERSAQIKDNLGALEKAWAGVKNWAGQAWDAMLNVGRQDTVDEQLVAAREKLDKLTSQPVGVYERGTHEARVARMREVVAGLEAESAAQALNAAASEHNAKAVAARVAWDGVVTANLDKQAKMERELASVREKAAAAGVQGAELEAQLAAVREKYAEKTKKASTVTETAYKSLISAITEKRAAVDKELSQGEKLTEYEKLRLRYQQDLVTRGREYSVAQRAKIEADLAALEVSEKQAIAERELVKAWEEDAKALEKLQQQREKQVETLQGNLQKLLLEEEAHALAAQAGITHAEAVERLTMARLEEHLAMARQGTESQATIDWLERELAVRQQIAQAMGQKGVREATEKAAQEAGKAWEKTAQTIGRTLEDYIMGGGKDAAQYLKRLFSTLVLQPVVQAGVGSLMGALGMDGGAQGASAGGGMGTAASMLQNGSSIYGALTGSLTYGLGSAIAGMGTALGASAATSFGAGMAASGFTAGAFGTGASMVGAGATSAGLGMMAGAALPWVAGALALYSIAKSFDNSGTLHYGAGAVYSGGQVQSGADIYNQGTFGMGARGEWNADAQQNASGIAGALGAALDGFAVGFGQKAGYTVATAFADDSSKDGAWGALRIADAVGNVLVDWESTRSSKWAPETFADGDEGYKQYLDKIAVDVKSAFLSMDLPQWSEQLLAAADDLDSLNAALSQIGAIKSQFDALGRTMSAFVGLSGDMQTQLINASGSMDALTQNAGTFYGEFYSEPERMQTLREQVNGVLKDLGVSLGASLDAFDGDAAKAAFRKHWQEAMDTGQGELAAQMLAVSGSFATAANYAQKLADSGGAAGDALADVGDVLARLERAGNAVRSAGSLLDTLSSSMGGAGDAYAQRYESRLWSALGSATGYEQQIELASELTDLVLARHSAEAQAQQAAVSAAQEQLRYAQSLQGYVQSLMTGNLSPLTTGEKMDSAGAYFQQMLAAAQAGDTTAQGNLQGAASSYLDLARTSYASGEQYTGIFASVTGALQSLGLNLQGSAQASMASAGDVVATQSLGELQRLYAITEAAYVDAEEDYITQQTLLTQQLQASEDVGTQLESLPALMSAELHQALAMPINQSLKDGNAAVVTQIAEMRKEMAAQAAENQRLQSLLVQVIAQSSEANAQAVGSAVGDAVQTATYQAAVKEKATVR